MNKTGQALVEFIIILPIFLLILLSIVDVGSIIYNRNILESEITDVISLYDGGNSITEITNKLDLDNNNIKLTINNNEVILTKELNILTPGLNLILNNPYMLKVERIIS